MSSITGLLGVQDSYTFQHYHGIMLVNLNKLAFELKLSHTEYHLMGVIIGYWNKKQGKSFPTVRMLAKFSRMGSATVIKSLKRLVDLGLLVIVKDGKNNRQTYYINQNKFLSSNNNTDVSPVKTQSVSACKNAHDIEQIDNRTNRTNILSKPKINKARNNKENINDDSFKSTNIKDYKQVLNTLNSYSFTGAKRTIKKLGVDKLKELINLVESKEPLNKGAYLRSLINNLNDNTCLNIKSSSERFNSTLNEHSIPKINQMIKHKYWIHKPTGKKLQVLPDVGSHLLIKYYKDEDMVMFLESGVCDKLERFIEQ